jgi:hypothetical protein
MKKKLPKKEKYPVKEQVSDLTEVAKLLMLLFRQYKVLDLTTINRFLRYSSEESCRIAIYRIMKKSDHQIKDYSFSYKNIKNQRINKRVFYMGDLDEKKLILIGAKFTENIMGF